MKIQIRPYQPGDRDAAVGLLADFYHAMWRLKGRRQARNLDSARKDLSDRLGRGESVFVADICGSPAGILIATAEPICKLECVFVAEKYREMGVAGRLFDAAEEHYGIKDEDSFYVSVHPNNRPVINLLKEKGYDVLNLIELRKRWPDERNYANVKIMDIDYQYEIGDLRDPKS